MKLCYLILLLSSFVTLDACKTLPNQKSLLLDNEANGQETDPSLRCINASAGLNFRDIETNDVIEVLGDKTQIKIEDETPLNVCDGTSFYIKISYQDKVGKVCKSYLSSCGGSGSSGGDEDKSFADEGANPIKATDIYFGEIVGENQYREFDNGGYLDFADQTIVSRNDNYGRRIAVNIKGNWHEVEIRQRGGLSRAFDKFNMTFDFKGSKPVLFGKERGKVVMNASWVDPSFLRNWLVMTSVRLLGGISPKFEFVQMRVMNSQPKDSTLGVLGVGAPSLYIATYHPTSHIRNTKNEAYKDATIIKSLDHSNWSANNRYADRFESIQGQAVSPDYFAHLDRHCSSGGVFNVEDFTRWVYIHNFFANSDTFSKNYYTFYTDSNDIHMYNWDADLSMGIKCRGDCSNVGIDVHLVNEWKVGANILSFWNPTEIPFNMCFEKGVGDNVNGYLEKFRQAKNGVLSQANLNSLIDSQAAWIKSAAEKDYELWKRHANLRENFRYDEGEVGATDADKFDMQIKILKAVIARRHAKIPL